MQQIDIEKSLEKLRDFKITVLPDFYLDILVDPRMSYQELVKEIDSVFSRGGGNLLGPEISFVAGGNGGNVAKTTAGLGANTTFISNSSPLGKLFIEFFLQPLGVNTNVSTTGKVATSLILEIPHGDDINNVMLCSSGSVVDYSSKKLLEEQWDLLKASSAIAVTNAQNFEMEDLVKAILDRTPKTTIVTVDYSDLTPHLDRINDFHDYHLDHPSHPPSLISGNENEFPILAKEPKKTPEKATESLSNSYPEIIFGLHMAKKVEIWKNGEQQAIEPSYKVSILKATGAGDNWHAGFLIGFYGLGMTYSEAARFSNAVAAYQISTGKIGNLEETIEFINKTGCYGLK